MQSEKPQVSIIIPTYNRDHLIGETLDSIINQTFRYWECIVVDDGSEDYTKELLDFYVEKDSRIRYLRRPGTLPSGANACRNLGFENSKGDLIKWLDSDDLLDADYLLEKIRLFENSAIDLVVCDYVMFTDDGKRSKPIHNRSNTKDLLLDYVSGKININSQSCLWRRFILKNKNFDTSLDRAQELDFHFRLLRDNHVNVEFLEENLVYIRSHSNSITGNFSKGNLEAIRSDLRVRMEILEYLKSLKLNKAEIEPAFNLYLIGIRQLIQFKHFAELKFQIDHIHARLKPKEAGKIWRFKLDFLYILFKLTGRSYKLQKHIASLKI